jgi:hypothetical protein
MSQYLISRYYDSFEKCANVDLPVMFISCAALLSPPWPKLSYGSSNPLSTFRFKLFCLGKIFL